MERSINLPTPASLNSSSENSAAHPPNLTNKLHNAPSKRNRTQLSCVHCRHAKLKCDRQEPCSQCMKRGRTEQCVFPAAKPGRKPAISMRKRLEHLESLVKNVMTGQSPEQIDSPSLSESDARKRSETSTSQSVIYEVRTGDALLSLDEEALHGLASTENGISNTSGSVVGGSKETAYGEWSSRTLASSFDL